MGTYANIAWTPEADGLPYALGTGSGVTVPTTNADNDLGDQTGPALASPVGVSYQAAVLAVVQLTIAGTGLSNAGSYVVLQTDMNDSNWIDLAWCVTSSTTAGTLTFALSAGVAGANAVALTRTAGTAPSSSGSNQLPLGGRIRFVGRSQLSGSSPSLKAVIRYKWLALR